MASSCFMCVFAVKSLLIRIFFTLLLIFPDNHLVHLRKLGLIDDLYIIF